MTYTLEEQKANRGKWVTALRSGKFKQGVGRLRRETGAYCCFGVACELAAEEGLVTVTDTGYKAPGQATHESVPPDVVVGWLGLTNNLGILQESDLFGDLDVLTELNDSGKWSFDQIADVIEAGGVKVVEP